MKFAAFGVAEYEKEYFTQLQTQTNISIDIYSFDIHQIEQITHPEQYDAISIVSLKKIDTSILNRFSKCKLIIFRTIGYDYIDLEYCRKRNITICNSTYEPYNVADFTIMLMLLLLRKAKISICRALVNDFSLDNMMGKELRNKKIGIVGTGKIGSTVIRQLVGFGCKIYCYDLKQNKELSSYAEYKDLDFIYKTCDIISLHIPITKENYHLIDKKALQKMKNGVILINTARGELIDTEALIEAIENLKIGAVALDTIEGEDGIAHIDYGAEIKGLSAKKNIMYIKDISKRIKIKNAPTR